MVVSFFYLPFYKTENNKNISRLAFSFLSLTNEKTPQKILFFVLFCKVDPVFSSCPRRHLHPFIIFTSFGCASDKAIMKIFDEADVIRKFGMNSICFYFCTDIYPHAHV